MKTASYKKSGTGADRTVAGPHDGKSIFIQSGVEMHGEGLTDPSDARAKQYLTGPAFANRRM